MSAPMAQARQPPMKILATLDEPTSGDAKIDDVSIVEMPEKARRWIGYVPDALPMHQGHICA